MPQDPSTTPSERVNILVAVKNRSDLSSTLRQLEGAEGFEIQPVNNTEDFLKALSTRPAAVVTRADFGTFTFLKFAREGHPQTPFLLIQEGTQTENVFHKGINVYLSESEAHRLLPWLEILLMVKNLGPARELDARAVEQLRDAASNRRDRIQSPSIEHLRREARRAEKTPAERDEAIRAWTQEIEQKKRGGAITVGVAPEPREDPLLPRTDPSLVPTPSPVQSLDPNTSRETIVTELLKIQGEMAYQIAQLNAEIRQIKQRKRPAATVTKRKPAKSPATRVRTRPALAMTQPTVERVNG